MHMKYKTLSMYRRLKIAIMEIATRFQKGLGWKPFILTGSLGYSAAQAAKT